MQKTEIEGKQESTRAHSLLLQNLQRMEQTLRGDATASPLTVRGELAAARSLISDHFGFEEQNGWKAAVLQQAPRFAHAVGQLLAEHRQLTRSLDTLIEEANASETLAGAFRQKTLRWIERVLEHEAREDDLLESAFVEDLGAGD